jgi:hypothetical protein
MPRRSEKTRPTSRRLETPIKIYAPSTTQGDYGEVSRAAADRTFIGFDMAGVTLASGSSVPTAGKLKTSQGYTVEIRRRDDVTDDCLIEITAGPLADTILTVQAIDRDGSGRGEMMVLVCL